jgi:hypothetical protein
MRHTIPPGETGEPKLGVTARCPFMDHDQALHALAIAEGRPCEVGNNDRRPRGHGRVEQVIDAVDVGQVDLSGQRNDDRRAVRRMSTHPSSLSGPKFAGHV